MSERPYFWTPVPDELQESILSRWYVTPEDRAALNRIAAEEWFLVKNELSLVADVDTSCRFCGAEHEYITTRCIELPFNSLRSLSVWIGSMPQTSAELFRAMFRPGTIEQPGTLVPISGKDAEKLHERIRAKRMPTIMEQRPLRRDETDAELIRRRIVSRALSLRDGKIRR